MTLTHKTITGVLWTFIEQLFQRGISIIVTLLLAKFLTPEHYGLIAMMSVFLAIANSIVDSGFSQALIRKQHTNQADYNTAFYANILLSMFAYLLLFVSAPLIANFYEQSQLTLLIRCSGIVVLINAFRLIQDAILIKNLNFKTQLKATIPSSLLSGLTAILLAYSGFGVWALVAQMIISAILINVFLWSFNLWRPTLRTDNDSLKEMFGFGYKLFLSGLLDTIFNNLYIVVIAKLFSTTIAGYYFFAENIKQLIINQLVSSIQKVTYPALSSKQHDDKALKDGYRKIIQVTTFILFPAMAIMATLALPIFQVLLPAKWMPASSYLQLMCIAALMHPIHSINLNILKVKGRSDLFLLLEVIKKALIVGVLLFTYKFGVYGILTGQIILSFLLYIPNSYYTNQLINYNIFEQVKDFAPALLLSSFTTIFTTIAMHNVNLSPLTSLFVFSFFAVGIYLLMAKLFKIHALVICYSLITKRLNLIK